MSAFVLLHAHAHSHGNNSIYELWRSNSSYRFFSLVGRSDFFVASVRAWPNNWNAFGPFSVAASVVSICWGGGFMPKPMRKVDGLWRRNNKTTYQGYVQLWICHWIMTRLVCIRALNMSADTLNEFGSTSRLNFECTPRYSRIHLPQHNEFPLQFSALLLTRPWGYIFVFTVLSFQFLINAFVMGRGIIHVWAALLGISDEWMSTNTGCWSWRFDEQEV